MAYRPGPGCLARERAPAYGSGRSIGGRSRSVGSLSPCRSGPPGCRAIARCARRRRAGCFASATLCMYLPTIDRTTRSPGLGNSLSSGKNGRNGLLFTMISDASVSTARMTAAATAPTLRSRARRASRCRRCRTGSRALGALVDERLGDLGADPAGRARQERCLRKRHGAGR